MKNRINPLLAALLSLALVLGTGGLSALAQKDDHPGFTVVQTGRLELVSADMTLYEHTKSGALVMTLENGDTNRAFDISFRTPTENDRGIPHVFEHATLGGSEKYPSKSLFFNLVHQTYNTYINAMTTDIMTTYPLASLSEDQLLRYVDYYADSVFHPSIKTDESIFLEEAWRLNLPDAGADLSLAGTVYTEMQGAYTIETAAMFNFRKSMFPGSLAGNSYGGDPQHIKEMTWADLKDYHDRYYHPSNSLTILYGKLEQIPAFLSLLDGYFGAFDRQQFAFLDEGFTPLDASVRQDNQFPVEAGSNTANGSVLHYGFVLADATKEEEQVLSLLETLLSEQSSVFMQQMRKQLPQASATVSYDVATPQAVLAFSATGANPEDAETFRQVVDQALVHVQQNGFDTQAVEAVAAATRLSVLLTTENPNVGVSLVPNIAYLWAATGDIQAFAQYVDNTSNYVAFAEAGKYQALVEKYLTNDPTTALVVTQPVAGLKEAQNQALADELAARKAAMTEEEINQLVAQTVAYVAEEADDSAQYVQQLQAVTVDSLPVERRSYALADQAGEDGVRRITADAQVSGVGQVLLLLDAGSILQEDIHWLKLYTDLLSKLDTGKHDNAALSALLTRYLYNSQLRLSVFSGEDGKQANPMLRVSFIAMDEDLAPAYDLVHEVLFDSSFADAAMVKSQVEQVQTTLKTTITNNAYNILAIRAFASESPSFAYHNYASFLDYYDFLSQTLALFETQPEAAINKLTAIQQQLNNRQGAILGFAGNANSQQQNQQASAAFFEKLPQQTREKAVYNLPAIANSEALVVDSAVQYNLMYASYEKLGMEGINGALEALTRLVSDAYLYPQLRDQYGAYGVDHSITEDGIYLLSFRDPNITQTFEVFAALPDFISELAIDQQTLDGYILAAYSNYALSQGELAGAFSAIMDQVDKKPQERYLKVMEQLKAITPEDVAAFAQMYQQLEDLGYRATAGGAGAITANASLYEQVYNPFAVVDTGPKVLTDVEDGAWYQQAVQFVVDNRLMQPLDDSTFGVTETATLGQFAGDLFLMAGGAGTPEEALMALSAMGMLPAGSKVEDTFTREQLASYLAKFLALVGMDVKADLPPLPEFADADQISPQNLDALRFVLANQLLHPLAEGQLAPQQLVSRADLAYLFYQMNQE